jgi:hypothetical protein
MTPDEKKALNATVRATVENSLAALDASEHIFALKSVLFSLDARAQKIFEEQLASERAKNQKRREGLQMLLAAGRVGSSGMQS